MVGVAAGGRCTALSGRCTGAAGHSSGHLPCSGSIPESGSGDGSTDGAAGGRRTALGGRRTDAAGDGFGFLLGSDSFLGLGSLGGNTTDGGLSFSLSIFQFGDWVPRGSSYSLSLIVTCEVGLLSDDWAPRFEVVYRHCAVYWIFILVPCLASSLAFAWAQPYVVHLLRTAGWSQRCSRLWKGLCTDFQDWVLAVSWMRFLVIHGIWVLAVAVRSFGVLGSPCQLVVLGQAFTKFTWSSYWVSKATLSR